MEMLVIVLIAIVAFAFVLIPLFRRKSDGSDDREFDTGAANAGNVAGAPQVAPMAAGPVTPVAPPPVVPAEAGEHVRNDVEADVQRYRRALRAGTVCRKCGEANPEESVFCADCGARLPLADAKEFE